MLMNQFIEWNATPEGRVELSLVSTSEPIYAQCPIKEMLANSADPDQMLQNVASDQDLRYLY